MKFLISILHDNIYQQLWTDISFDWNLDRSKIIFLIEYCNRKKSRWILDILYHYKFNIMQFIYYCKDFYVIWERSGRIQLEKKHEDDAVLMASGE